MFDKADLKDCIFEGVVKVNNDPKNLQRVKVRIPIIHDKVKNDNDLPWCLKIADSICGSGPDYGQYNIPAINEIVYVQFQMGDENNPIYHGRKAFPISSFNVNSYGFQDSKGNRFIVNKQTGVTTFRHFTGKSIVLAADGSLQADVENFEVNCVNAVVNCSGALQAECVTAELTASASVVITSPSVDIN